MPRDRVEDFISVVSAPRRLVQSTPARRTFTSPLPDHYVVQEESFRNDISRYVPPNQSRRLYLRCHEPGSATEPAGSGYVPHLLLEQTIVSKLNVATQRQEDVVQFQITRSTVKEGGRC